MKHINVDYIFLGWLFIKLGMDIVTVIWIIHKVHGR